MRFQTSTFSLIHIDQVKIQPSISRLGYSEMKGSSVYFILQRDGMERYVGDPYESTQGGSGGFFTKYNYEEEDE